MDKLVAIPTQYFALKVSIKAGNVDDLFGMLDELKYRILSEAGDITIPLHIEYAGHDKVISKTKADLSFHEEI